MASWKYRRPQKDLADIGKEILEGSTICPEMVLADVAPGAGKSFLVPIWFAALKAAGVVDRVCWVVPRVSLIEQAAVAFLDERLREELGHTYEIRGVTNQDQKPVRGEAIGFAVTYQGLLWDSQISQHEMRRHKYLLVLDEPHHCSTSRREQESSAWTRAIQPLYDLATTRLLMSGTFRRHDDELVAFVPYVEKEGGFDIDFRDTPERRVIRYSISDSRKEKAIVGIDFVQIDARAEWLSGEGKTLKTETLGSNKQALYVALQTGYATALLAGCIEHWKNYRHKNTRSKVLVVCSNVPQARKMHTYLTHELDVSAKIAVSEDSQDAQNNIKAFRKGGCHVLVTVAMAYEGLDVPEATHLACLTHVRSVPWLIQMFARLFRIDASCGLPYEEQSGYAWVPDDDYMTEARNEIPNPQNFIPSITPGPDDPKEPKEGPNWPKAPLVVPLGSSISGYRASRMAGESLSSEQTSQVHTFRDRHPFLSTATEMQIWGMIQDPDKKPSFPQPVPSGPALTMNEKEVQQRKRIRNYTNSWERKMGKEFGWLNRLILKRGWMPRGEMSSVELHKLWLYIQKTWPFPLGGEQREAS